MAKFDPSRISAKTEQTVRDIRKTIDKEGENILEIEVDLIDPNPFQPRLVFDQQKVESLAESMSGPQGLISPVVVRAHGGRFELMSGERRLRASKHLGWETIKAIIRDISDHDMMISAAAENNHREDLTDLEKALSYAAMDKVMPSRKKLAEEAGIGRQNLYRYLAIAEMPAEVMAVMRQYPHAVTNTNAIELKQAVEDLQGHGIEIEKICDQLISLFNSAHPKGEWATRLKTTFAITSKTEAGEGSEQDSKSEKDKSLIPTTRRVKLISGDKVYGKVALTPKAMQVTLPTTTISEEQRTVFLERLADLVNEFTPEPEQDEQKNDD